MRSLIKAGIIGSVVLVAAGIFALSRTQKKTKQKHRPLDEFEVKLEEKEEQPEEQLENQTQANQEVEPKPPNQEVETKPQIQPDQAEPEYQVQPNQTEAEPEPKVIIEDVD